MAHVDSARFYNRRTPRAFEAAHCAEEGRARNGEAGADMPERNPGRKLIKKESPADRRGDRGF